MRAQLSIAAMPRTLQVGGAAVACVVAVTLVHLTGADLRAGYGIAYPGLFPELTHAVIAAGRAST